jgi:hypothetical protein
MNKLCHCNNESTEMKYNDGKLTCPKCNKSEDISKETFTCIIAVGIDNRIAIIKIPKEKLIECLSDYEKEHPLITNIASDESYLNGFLEDIYNHDEKFEDISPGIYKVDIYWHYYRCNWEVEEYDLELEIMDYTIFKKNSWIA